MKSKRVRLSEIVYNFNQLMDENNRQFKDLEGKLKTLDEDNRKNVARIKELEEKVNHLTMVDELQNSEIKALKSQISYTKCSRENQLVLPDNDSQELIKYETKNQFDLEELFTNSGFYYIAKRLISNFDFKNLANLVVVSKPIRAFVLSQRHWLASQLKIIRSNPRTFTLTYYKNFRTYGMKFITEQFPWYNSIFDYVEKNTTFDEFTVVLNDLKWYFQEKGMQEYCTPFLAAIYGKKNNFVQNFLRFPKEFIKWEEKYALDCGNMTPFTFACNYGKVEAVTLMLDFAEEREIDLTSGYPLHFACGHGHTAVVKLLLERHANIYELLHLINPNGKTPLELAKYMQHDEIVHLIEAFFSKAITKRNDEIN